MYGPYQAVVLAAPLVGSGLAIEEWAEADEAAAAFDSGGGAGGAAGAAAVESSSGGGHEHVGDVNLVSAAVGEGEGEGEGASAHVRVMTRRRLLFSDSASSHDAAAEQSADSSTGSGTGSSTSTSRAPSGDGVDGTAAALQRPYQVTITTFVAAGRLRAAFFNASALPPGLSAVLVTDSAQVPFTAVAARRLEGPDGGEEGEGELVYKARLAAS